MHELIEKLLEKRGIELKDLDADERDTFDKWQFTLTNKKCTDKKIIKLARELGMPKEVENKFLAGTVKDAKDGLQKMCYMVSPADDNLLFVVDVLGNSGVVPKKEMGM